MHRSILSAATVALLGASAHAAVVWDWKYEADVTPDTSGSVFSVANNAPWSSFSPYLAVPATSSASGGLYTAGTLVTGGGGAGGWLYPVGSSNLAYLNNQAGYTVEWRVRVNTIDGEDDGPGSMTLELEDGDSADAQWFGLGFDNVAGQYQAMLYGGNLNEAVVANINAGEFNTYRVTVLNGIATLYMNDNPTPIGTINNPRADINSNELRWADATGLNDSNYTVDYLYASGQGAVAPIPEPASLSLLALGALAMVRRRA